MGRLLPAVLLASIAAAALAGGEEAPGPVALELDGAASELTVHVGKAGLFSFAGHEHDVRALRLTGRVVVDAQAPGGSSVSLRVESASLTVSPGSEPAGDLAKVQATMSGPQVLDAARFPEIAFDSTGVEAARRAEGTWDAVVTGNLRIREVTRPVRLEVRVEMQAGRLVASGKAVLKQTDFGIRPVSVGGVVRVRDELDVAWRLVARSP